MTIAVTAGEPAGIGPDLCLALAKLALNGELDAPLTLIGNRALFEERARMLGLDLALRDYSTVEANGPGNATGVSVLDIPLAAPCVAGRLDVANARHVLAMLDRAIDGAMSGEFAAIVTAPVQKSVINDAGVPFTGHTEYLAERTHAAHPVMLLAADKLRVALATTHLPLRAVSDAISPALLDTVLRIVNDDVRRLWGVSRPRIAVCGLNPHAGESGHLGTEDRDVIAPAIERARAPGCWWTAPCPPTPCSCRATCLTTTWCWPCTTTRACRCSSTRASATRSTSPWACPWCAPRWTMARRSTSPAPAAPTLAACWPPRGLPIEFAARA